MAKISDLFCAFCFVVFVGHGKSEISEIYWKFSTYFVGVFWSDLKHNLSDTAPHTKPENKRRNT